MIGYGTVLRKDLTGSVGSIRPNQITKSPASNVTEMLRGQAAGVQVSLGTGAPGSPSNIRIRVNRSIKGNNAPLYVVDGMMVPNIDNIDPSDIQSIDILKDASSQAVYGSRASNGVILVTTRRGAVGKTTVNVNSSLGFHKFTKNFDLYSPQEYIDLRYWGMANSGTAGIGTSIGFIDQEGIVKTTEFKRGNFRTNIDASPYKWLDLSTNFSYARSEQHLPNSSFFHILTMSPLSQARNEDGSVRTYGTSTRGDVNPLLRNTAAKERKKTTTLLWDLMLHSNSTKGYPIALGLTY